MVKLPERFTDRMRGLLREEYEDFIKSYDREPALGLRLNSLKTEEGRREGWEKEADYFGRRLAQKTGFELTTIPWVEEGYYFDASDRPGKHPFHEAGLYYIQEPSAMAVAELLDPRPGDCVLDLCAAPGGKSSHIASRLKGKGFLLSNEIHPSRAKILSQNIERMGVSNCVVANEEPIRLTGRFPEFFDKIVVDAPCSGEGMFRKDEEARKQWSEDQVHVCAVRQKEILNHAAAMLCPGGRMVYSTCTFAPEENEGVIGEFLIQHEDFYLEQTKGCEMFSQGRPGWVLTGERRGEISDLEPFHLERTFRLMPHKLKGEGHFIAVLRKEDGAAKKALKPGVYLDWKKRKEQKQAFWDFLSAVLLCPESFLEKREYTLFGDQLFLLPPQMPDLSGLKILRPGLHMGTFKKNRFEPSHALALSLLSGEVKGWYDLPGSSEETVRYLKGEALVWEPSRLHGKQEGWILICTEGYSLGWCKLTGKMLKNHYPKGLRWV